MSFRKLKTFYSGHKYKNILFLIKVSLNPSLPNPFFLALAIFFPIVTDIMAETC